jgi:6-phosphogluconolactonase (cycloisomerase 2 family)
LGSQNPIVFQAATNRFFAVNAGDNSISMLALEPNGELTLLSNVDSGGIRPITIAAHGDLVYVANEGDRATIAANITGFRVVGPDLVPIAGSTQALSVTDARPGQIGFTPDGTRLIVTEKATHHITTFVVTAGVAGPAKVQSSSGMTPFAFTFSPEGFLVVAEVGAGGGPTSSVSSYGIAADGTLTPLTAALATNQTAACWIVEVGGFAYVANAASATITGVAVGLDGMLALRDASGVTATTGAVAIDMAATPDGGFLYSLSGNPRGIRIFELGADGSLTAKPTLSDVPPMAAGLVAR